MNHEKRRLIKVFKCPILECNKYVGYVSGGEAWCYHNGVGYKMIEDIMEVKE